MAGETESVSDLLWEDGLLERKVESDLKDLLKTIVAFANSVRPGHTALILIGEKDDGSAQGLKSPDNIQKTVIKTAIKFTHQFYGRQQSTREPENTVFELK